MDHIKVYINDIYYSIFLLPVYNKKTTNTRAIYIYNRQNYKQSFSGSFDSKRGGEEKYSVPSDHEVSIMRLVSMGFSREQAIESLQSTVSLE